MPEVNKVPIWRGQTPKEATQAAVDNDVHIIGASMLAAGHLMLAGAGDELQGIKRGLPELADMIAITKADGENVSRAKLAASKYAFAMHLLRGGEQPPVVTCSALDGSGIDDDLAHHRRADAPGGERSVAPSGRSAARRRREVDVVAGRRAHPRERCSKPMRTAASPKTPSAKSASSALSAMLAVQAIVHALRCSETNGRGSCRRAGLGCRGAAGRCSARPIDVAGEPATAREPRSDGADAMLEELFARR